MKKSDIVRGVSNKTGLSEETAEEAVNTILSTIGDALSRGETVLISGFGRFTVRTRPPHIGRRPGTGESMRVGISKTPLFKAGKRLKQVVN